MDWKRLLRHLVATRRKLERAFPVQALEAIGHAIAESEREHSGEIRFAIEAALEPAEIWAGKPPRQRALEVFSALGVWDTEANNGILIYLLLADRDVEIVADRGFNGKVSAAEWSAVCVAMEGSLRAGRYEDAAIDGVREAGKLLARHFPPLPGGRDEDELPNRPAVL
ncbi:MAG TPA: TPM domain-containing protein [Steroidobacteraceae bacterium]|nr:TPM domain-containing protein [Steroidobacteraceae bacterium]